MKYSENALNILTARTYPQKGPAWIHKNFCGNDDISRIYGLLETHEYEFRKKRDRIESAVKELGDSVDGLVALGDADFPRPRGTVKPADHPFALFYKGDIGLLRRENLNVAVIGVLNPDEKIELTERMVTTEILRHGATIVSGLALGCDTIAHKTALDHGGKTIAILPSALDNILPKENVELAERIVDAGGLLISEYYEAPRSRNDMVSRFVVRDRLQAMFSDAVLLSASYAPNNMGNDCGSRHAMEKAKTYGIKRGVIYNEGKHRDLAVYDLNRRILAEDGSVVRIDSSNMVESVKSLVARRMEGALF